MYLYLLVYPYSCWLHVIVARQNVVVVCHDLLDRCVKRPGCIYGKVDSVRREQFARERVPALPRSGGMGYKLYPA